MFSAETSHKNMEKMEKLVIVGQVIHDREGSHDACLIAFLNREGWPLINNVIDEYD